MTSHQDWHVPYHQDALTLQAALANVSEALPANATQPLMLQWLASLQDHNQGLHHSLAHLDRHQHDCIHVVLGRGLLETDEAFTTGFLLASACKGSMTEQGLNAFIAQHMQPLLSSLPEHDLAVFREAVKLALISGCVALNRFEFADWQEQSLRELRDAIGLEHELITAYYSVEQRRYPRNKASQRLVPASKQVAAF